MRRLSHELFRHGPIVRAADPEAAGKRETARTKPRLPGWQPTGICRRAQNARTNPSATQLRAGGRVSAPKFRGGVRMHETNEPNPGGNRRRCFPHRLQGGVESSKRTQPTEATNGKLDPTVTFAIPLVSSNSESSCFLRQNVPSVVIHPIGPFCAVRPCGLSSGIGILTLVGRGGGRVDPVHSGAVGPVVLDGPSPEGMRTPAEDCQALEPCVTLVDPSGPPMGHACMTPPGWPPAPEPTRGVGAMARLSALGLDRLAHGGPARLRPTMLPRLSSS